MRCPSCRNNNEQGRKFCANCGEPLGSICPSCKSVNSTKDKFCGECGVALAGVPLNQRTTVRAGGTQNEAGRFRALVENTADVLWEVDVDGRYTYISPNIKMMLNYEAEELIGKTPFDLMSPADAASLREIFAQHVAAQEPFQLLTHKSVTRDGRSRYIECSGTPIFDDSWKISGFRGVDRDVTERLAREEERRKLAQAVLAIGEALAISDPEGHIEYMNPAAEQLLGYITGELTGRYISELYPGGEENPVLKSIFSALTRGSWSGEVELQAKDGSRVLTHETATPILDEAGTLLGYICINTDIRQTRALEDQLQQRINEITALNRFSQESLGEYHRMVEAYQELMRQMETNPAAYQDILERARSIGTSAPKQLE